MVIKRMRQKVLCHGKKEANGIKTEWYGLKSSKTPQQVKELTPVENDLIALVQNIRFIRMRNHLQNKKKKDIQLIKSSDQSHFRRYNNKPLLVNKSGIRSYDKQRHDLEIQEASNNIKKQINIDGKQILKNREALN